VIQGFLLVFFLNQLIMPNRLDGSLRGLSILVLSAVLLVQSATALKAKPKAHGQASAPKLDALYEQARRELPENIYVVYRIVDRLARANGLDQTPWRVQAIKEYNVNAFATEINLIALYTGLMDQLAGDASGIACVVGHEMAHHTQRHQAMGKMAKTQLLDQYRREAEAAAQKEVNEAQSEATSTALGGTLLQSFGGLLGGWGSATTSVLGSAAGRGAQNRMAESQRNVQAIVALKEQELAQKMAENERNQEFEADRFGYQYMVRAGFDPEGCFRVMEVLGRTPAAEFDTTHPATRKRVEQLKALMQDYPAHQLAREGQQSLGGTRPLSYSISEDGTSLRVNSRHGGSTADSLDRMFSR
jgi:beta-barrel assembly-enhancing protease